MLAICGSASAATLHTLSLGMGTPGINEPQMQGMDLSANGQYVCGILEMGSGFFVGDWRAKTFVYGMSETDDSELRHVDNQGVAIGYDGDECMTFNTSEVEKFIVAPEGYKYVLGEDITDDGSILVGSAMGAGYIGEPVFAKDGGEWQFLSMDFGTDVNLGFYEGDGGYAKLVSGDGKIIAGCVGNFGPATIWRLDDNGNYEPDFIAEKYVMLTEDDSEKKFAALYPVSISNNGKYILIKATENSDSRRSYPVVYNTETCEMTCYDEEQEIDMYEAGLYPSAICNDGTFIGLIGVPMLGDFGAFIMKAGATQAISFTEAFPEYAEYFGMMDMMSCHTPVSMSADGRYILGYGWTSPDPYDDDAIFYFETYVLDTNDSGTSAIDAVEAASDAVPVEYYTIDGRANAGASKGINIVRMSDGSVRKVIVK